MAGARPVLEIPLTRSDKVLEVLCWSGLVALWLATFFVYADLPYTIPVHFNVAGKIDRLGTKNNIWAISAITTLLVIGLTLLNLKPHIFNYPEEITPENAERNYKMGTRLLRYLKLFIVILFGAILLVTAKSSDQDFPTDGSNPAVVAILIVVMLLPVAILIYISRQSAN